MADVCMHAWRTNYGSLHWCSLTLHEDEHVCGCGAVLPIQDAVPDVPPVAAGGGHGGAVTPPRHDPDPPPSELDEVAGIMRVILRDTDARRRSEHMETAVLAAAFALAFPGELSRRVLVDTLRTLRDDMPHGDSEDHR